MSVAMQRQFPQIQILRRKSQRGSAGHCFPIREELQKETRQVSLGWTSDTVNVHVDALCKTLEMKARSFAAKIMDVSDVQVSEKDGLWSRSNTIKSNSNIVRERIWTLDSHFANKIVKV